MFELICLVYFHVFIDELRLYIFHYMVHMTFGFSHSGRHMPSLLTRYLIIIRVAHFEITNLILIWLDKINSQVLSQRLIWLDKINCPVQSNLFSLIFHSSPLLLARITLWLFTSFFTSLSTCFLIFNSVNAFSATNKEFQFKLNATCSFV